MKVIGDYARDGYAHLEGLVPEMVAQAFMASVKEDLGPGPLALSRVQNFPNLLKRPALEIYGHHYKPMVFFLWGLTPTISGIVGKDLAPTYDYFRLYRGGDLCRVHWDRYSCEHSLSLTLAYSDGEPWDLEIGKQRYDQPSSKVEDVWGDEAYSSVPMKVGDAVLYQGVNHRHGRSKPNPNRWSAHLFLHWVDRDGPYREHAMDGREPPQSVDFSFA
jgi:hypothetical protein